MTIKDDITANQKKIFDMLEALEQHLKPNALALVANDVRYLLHGLSAALKQYIKVKEEWQLSEQAASILTKLDRDYAKLEEKINTFTDKWVLTEAIEKNPELFVDQSRQLLTEVYKYFNLEKEQLFTRVRHKDLN